MIASVQMWIRVPPTMREAISDVATVHGTTMADVITTALEEYMGRHFPERAVVVRTRLPMDCSTGNPTVKQRRQAIG